MIENEVKACENWFSPLFYLFLFLFCLFFLAPARTSPCQQSLSFASSILAFSRRLSHSKKKFERLCSPQELLHWRERERCFATLLFATTALVETVCFLVLFLFLFLLVFFVFFLSYVCLSIVAFLPMTRQFLFHSACNVTTYQPSNTLRKSGKQVTALARVQALEKQLKRKWTTSSHGKQATFRDANIYSSRKDV